MTSEPPPGTTVLRLRPDRTQRLEALLQGAGPHLEPVLDIGSATNGDLLLLLPAPAARLVELLVSPEPLTAGEAVTVLVPLAQALQRLHAAGVAHGGVRPAAVVLDAEGSPAWTAPVAPLLLRKAGPTRFAAGVAGDARDYRSLCEVLLTPLGIGIGIEEVDGLERLEAALFGIAPAEPVRLHRHLPPPVPGTPARLLPAVAAPASMAARGPGSPVVAAVLRQVRSVRPRVWVALGGATVLLVTALTLLPSGTRAPAAPAAEPSSTRAAPPVASTPVAGRVLTPDAAIGALLTERERCLTAGDRACLHRVDAVDSPVLAADLLAAEAGVEAVRVDRTRIRVTSVSGGTVLATAGRVTVLAIRDRNDWRLRDVVAEPPDAG
ncbi:MAG: hypothetical protein HIU86_09995 [Acidobacteria bacterium]|nr:hypothetical protein [Acidobacteriota bacterium]